MTKLLLRHMAFMCLFLMLGMTNFITALFVSKMWIFILGEVSAISSLFIAFINYRQARIIAKVIDDQPTLTLTINKHGEESESKGQKQGDSKEKTACNDESENEYAHPV